MTAIQQTLREARDSVLTAPDGALTIGWRCALWDAMDGEFPSDAHSRRSVLAHAVARRLLPVWQQLEMEAVDQRVYDGLLSLAQDVIEGKVASDAAALRFNELDYHAQAIDLDSIGDQGFFALRAALSACNCARRDERRHAGYDLTLQDAQIDPDFLDTHFLASCVAAGTTWDPESDPSRRRAFWLDWLDRMVPSVLGAAETLSHVLHQ